MTIEVIKLNYKNLKCRLCEGNTIFKFKKEILNKYEISYHECSNCHSLQTEEPYWLEDAYSCESEKFDTGKATRTFLNFTVLPHLYNALGMPKGINYVDWGGGTGLFARLMRDIGFNYKSYDKYAKNEFAQGYEVTKENDIIDTITLFEVVEHFPNPTTDWENIFNRNASTIIFSTLIYDGNDSNWHYLAPENGQHVFFYSAKALSMLAEKNNYYAYKVGDYFLFKNSSLNTDEIDRLNEFVSKKETLQAETFNQWRQEPYKYCTTDLNSFKKISTKKENKKIIIDGVFFQINNSGIARVWECLLTEWSKTPLAKKIIILNRGGTAPLIHGLEYLNIESYDYQNMAQDEVMLEKKCKENNASLFISTYYTTPKDTNSLLMIHDLIPETLKWNMTQPMWVGKINAINHASNYVCVSHNTADDLKKFYPNRLGEITVAHCGVLSNFKKSSQNSIESFKEKYGITKKYFLTVGERGAHKNIRLFFEGLTSIDKINDYEVICLGGQRDLEFEFQGYAKKISIKRIRIEDSEMPDAYSGALALVYPSLYEGFGMPIVEAMACECPVITCPNGSIPEVASDAAIYVDSHDSLAMSEALLNVQKSEIRKPLIAKGLKNSERFSWINMANIIAKAIYKAEASNQENTSNAEKDQDLYTEAVRYIEQLHSDRYSTNALLKLQKVRSKCAQYIANTPIELFESRFNTHLKKTHNLLLKNGGYDLPRTDEDQNFLEKLYLFRSKGAASEVRDTLILMLFSRPHFLGMKFELSALEQDYSEVFLNYILTPPSNFIKNGEADLYANYLTEIAHQVHEGLMGNSKKDLWVNVAVKFINTLSIIPLYFSSSNLKEVMSLRAKIIENLMSNMNNSIELGYEFKPRNNELIRIGILAAHFQPQTETYATLPAYQYLDPKKYEVILISQLAIGNHPLENLCKKSSNSNITLSGDIKIDVNAIRDLDLDFIWIGTNLTAVLNYMVQLSVHRLARVQVTGGCSPVTTGFKNIDIFCSGNLTESNQASADYTEKLYLIDGPAHCFDMSESLNIEKSGIKIDRSHLGIPAHATAFISGANFFKLIPELLDAWISILKNTTDTYLVLFPFNPNWTSDYPAANLLIQIENILEKNGIDKDRIILVKPLKNRLEILELIENCNIYLDSFPYSGMTSLLDPLEVKIPIVALEGMYQRERMSASALKSLNLEGWISSNTHQYIKRAIEIASNKELQQEMRAELTRAMKEIPKFLDSKLFCSSIEKLIIESTEKL